MRDWTWLKAELAEGLQISREEAGWFRCTTIEGHHVLVEHTHGSAVDWLVMRTRICAQNEMDPELVLERNGTLAFAVMVLMKGTYWLRVAIPFDSMELANPKQLVSFLVEGARSLAPHSAAVPASSDQFGHYSE